MERPAAPNVRIRPVEPGDAEALTALLVRNRDYFRTGEPRRADAYYTVAEQRAVIERAMEASAAGTARLYVIEVDGRLGGRLNLNSVIRGAFQSASVGYVVDEALAGRGVATAALRQLVEIAFGELGLHRLQGETLVDNLASQRVLTRCGFVHYGRAPDYLRIDGRWQTHDLFQLVDPGHDPA